MGAFEVEGDSQGMPVSFCPAPDSGDVGDLGNETEQDEDKHAVIGV